MQLNYPSRKYVPELDGVRGIAVWMVLLYHCFPGPFTHLGWIGVDLFFVLSGFLITGILVDTKGTNRYYLNFITRRILRIFPLYYMVLLVVFVLLPLAFTKVPGQFHFYLDHQAWFWTYLQNWMYSFKGFPENHLLVHLWSLGVEEQFYLFWPFVVWFVPDKYLLRTSVGLCFLALAFRAIPLNWFNLAAPYRYMATLPRMDALLIGAIIAQLIRKDRKLLERIAIPVGLSGLVVFMLGVIITGEQGFLKLSAYFTPLDLFMGLLLLLSFSKYKRTRAFLRNSILVQSGKYSYGIYVYHYIIFNTLRYVIFMKGIVIFENDTLRNIAIGTLTIIPTLIISYLSYKYFESPFLKLKHYFRYETEPKVKTIVG